MIPAWTPKQQYISRLSKTRMYKTAWQTKEETSARHSTSSPHPSAPALSPTLSPSVHSALAPASERSLISNKKQVATERAKRAEFFFICNKHYFFIIEI